MRSKRWNVRAASVLLSLAAVFAGGCGGEGGESAAGAACETAVDCGIGSGLQCIDGACATCVLGEVGCPCRAGARCEAGAVCAAGNVCAAPDCTLGSEGCACTPSGGCVDGDWQSRRPSP